MLQREGSNLYDVVNGHASCPWMTLEWNFVAEAGFEPLSCDLRLMRPARTTELLYSAMLTLTHVPPQRLELCLPP
jgi:hypothetical protein